MELAVVSDTHGHEANARAAALMIAPFEPEAVIHCGDIGTPAIVSIFANWPTHYVFGNTDTGFGSLRAAMAADGGSCHERFGSVEFAGRKIAFLHGDDGRLLDQTIHSGQYDLVCHGHTHVTRLERVGKTHVLNPGALFRANPHSLAIVTLPELKIEFLTL